MTQKDKVKELVGRGLNSYHTKALQQMDRIEKKNKEQNHKISILSNELDNDYLTKTEEGSVVSLEHSKEGMVYLDELQGNTLVNYCTDGSKEMTLNGDIDVEGTFVTTTEGVDNGKVDVMCEGNTLVNLVKCNNVRITVPQTGFRQVYIGDNSMIKPNTTYTVIHWAKKTSNHNPTTTSNVPYQIVFGGSTTGDNWGTRFSANNGDITEYSIKKFTTPSTYYQNSQKRFILIGEYNRGSEFDISIVVLEGDWTNKEIPTEYFEGMKSVGECEDNKIEILSAKGKPNLFKNSGFLNGFNNYNTHNGVTYEIVDDNSTFSKKALKFTTGTDGTSGIYQYQIIPYIENIKYTISGWCKGEVGTTLQIHIERHKSINVNFTNEEWVRFEITSETNPTNWNRTITFYSPNNSKVFYLKDIKAEKSDFATPYIPHTTESNYSSFINKKEILLNEPLRYTGSTRDRFVKMGGKIFIERNTIELLLDKSVTNIGISSMDFTNKDIQLFFIRDFNNIIKSSTNNETWLNLLSDKFNSNAYNTLHRNNIEGVAITQDGAIGISILKSRLSTVDIDGFKQWLSNNNVKIICELATPIYEPLEIEPVLSCYLEVTHISNNSIIPCNMKIKNSGYNAIIKPSTLYTVALDTSKSGTIGMNLGGTKGTTTNNVLTLTTPATPTDDSLRLYGKGIKGSKVRLLEGDKTNWIPSHFEGMKSSFEDKFDSTDNTYKMEILSNNENHVWNVVKNGDCIFADVLLSSNTTYTINTSSNGTLEGRVSLHPYGTRNHNVPPLFIIKDWESSSVRTFTTPSNIEGLYTILLWKAGNSNGLTDDYYITIKRGNDATNHIERSINKIQFSSIEPLRKWDKFIFKDGRLMIERRSATFTLNSKNGYGLSAGGWENKTDVCTFEHYKPTPTAILDNTIKHYADTVPSLTFHQQWTESGSKGREGISTHQQGGFVLSIKRSKLKTQDVNGLDEYLRNNPIKVTYQTVEPTYEEIPFELQKIILEGYENGTLFIDTNIPPTSTVTYAGETPIVKSIKLNKTEVLNNTNDINDNIIPYLMDMDYRVVCLQLEGGIENVSMARLFGGTYEILQRDILSNRYSKEEYKYRLDAYLSANKITEDEYNKLGDMLND